MAPTFVLTLKDILVSPASADRMTCKGILPNSGLASAVPENVRIFFWTLLAMIFEARRQRSLLRCQPPGNNGPAEIAASRQFLPGR
jgi:hypothetical protein